MNQNQGKKDKNGALIAVIVLLAAAFIALGYFIFQISGIAKGVINRVSDGTHQETVVLQDYEKVLDYAQQDIELQLIAADVHISPSEDDSIIISYSETAEVSFTLRQQEDSIILEENHRSNFFLGSCPPVTIFLPESFDGKISCSTVSGMFSATSLSLLREVDVDTTSGNIEMNYCSADSIELDTTSGDIELKSSTCGETELNTTSGEMELSGLVCTKLGIDTTSGDARLEKLDFSHLKFDSVSGSLRGSILGCEDDFTVYFDSVSGGNSLKNLRGSGSKTIDFSSVSGSLRLELEDETEAA